MFFLLELLCELIQDFYIYLMCLILPKKRISETFRFILELIIGVISILFIVSIVFGSIMLLLTPEEEDMRIVAKNMVFIPINISVIQILLGIIVRIAVKIYNKNKNKY